MSKIMQNLVVFMEPSEDAYNISMKAGNMILNRFSIDEDAAFESSGVIFLKKSSTKIIVGNEIKKKEKGKEYSYLPFFKLPSHQSGTDPKSPNISP